MFSMVRTLYKQYEIVSFRLATMNVPRKVIVMKSKNMSRLGMIQQHITIGAIRLPVVIFIIKKF